ncbi:T-complex protein 1 subunit beta [Morella rubra]|uniref:CCT-beta n=1 Tax=Morella rubra TaxID=262757 RepID=A0A6A1UMK7_9ROSI|nr:T-complex protein 1 subunit beta [Morella rubra]
MPLNLAGGGALGALLCVAVSLLLAIVGADDPYRFFNWNVTYGDIYPLGVRQQGILINGQFPGPDIHSVTNDNLIINVFNSLDEPFLLSWNGIQNRRNSFEDGVYGTTCPIPPGKNFTYILQVKDQIGSFYYFPSLAFHKAAGGFGGIRILSRPRIPVPFPDPAGDYTVLIGDWYKANHTDLKALLERGKKLHFPDGVLINGRGPGGASFSVEQGKTYRLRISNVGLQHSLNFRIQGHKMKLVEVEGTHTLQTTFSSLDVHVGQSYSVLVTADQPSQDYYVVVSTRFSSPILTTTGTLRYSNSAGQVSGPPPGGPTIQIDWSLNQARAIRTNLTASGPRPNPQGSYHYGLINTTRTIRLQNSAGLVSDKQRYAVNSVSFVPADTPLKLADYFQIGGVFRVGSISPNPTGGGIYLDTSVMNADYRAFIEIVFENTEDIIQSWHLDGYSFWVVGMDGGQWTPANRNQYNLRDAVARCTTQVYPNSWTAIYLALDNVGMWNLRSEFWARQYLGQQFYLRVYTASTSLRDEYPIPKNALLCGSAITWSQIGYLKPGRDAGYPLIDKFSELLGSSKRHLLSFSWRYVERIFKDEASEEKGDRARMSSFVGAMAIADLVKTTLGPKGMDKILQSTGRGHVVTVTNDGATILKSLHIDNPAAKVLVGILATVLLFDDISVSWFEYYLTMEDHCLSKWCGYRMAAECARNALLQKVVDNKEDAEKFKSDLMKIAMTTLSSKILSQDKEHFAKLAVDAVLRLKGSTNLEAIQIIKKPGGSLKDSFLDEGFILDKKIGVGQPKRIENAKILVANTAMDTDKVKIYGARVRVDSMSRVAEIEGAEKEKMREKVQKIIAHGINCFINRQLIYNFPEELFADAGILAIEHADFDGIERLALVTGGEIASTFDNPESVKVGHCKLIEEIMIGEDKLIHFSGVELGQACTVVLRGASHHVLDEAERSLHDALCVLSQTVNDSRVLLGGGWPEMVMAKDVDELARKTPGKKSHAIEAFSRALVAIPTIIADNAGLDSAELVAQLRAEHQEEGCTAGIDVISGSVGDMAQRGISEAFKVKQAVLLSATEAAEMILRVDEIITCAPRKRENRM